MSFNIKFIILLLHGSTNDYNAPWFKVIYAIFTGRHVHQLAYHYDIGCNLPS